MLNNKYMHTNHYLSKVQQLKKLQQSIPYNLEIANFGSTYGKYAFEYLGEKNGFNFSLEPQYFYYMDKMIRQYRNHLTENAVVLLVIPTGVFLSDGKIAESRGMKYYHFMNPEYIYHYNWIKKVLNVKYPLFKNPLKMRYIWKDMEFADREMLADSLCKTSNEVYEEARRRTRSWCKKFGLNSTEKLIITEKLKRNFEITRGKLNQIIQYCTAEGLVPVLIIPPVSKEMNELTSHEFLDKVLYQNIEKINKDNILILDYLQDQDFEDWKLYINSDCLNMQGRKLFTERVFKDLLIRLPKYSNREVKIES